MSQDKSSRVRRHSRHNNERTDDMTNNVQDSEYSSVNESPDQPKSTTSTPSKREREISSSSVKSSSSRRQIVKSKNSNESENEGNRDSSTYTKYESVANDKKIEIIDTVRKIENFLMTAKKNNDNRDETESADYYDNASKKKKKRRKSKKRKEKNRNLDSNRTEDDDDDEAYYDEDRRSSERDLSRSRMKKLRANIPQKTRRKRHRSKGDSSGKNESQDKELPITEILRKAQENPKTTTTRHEESLPMVELTTDRIYVQGRNGFSSVKIPNKRSNGFFDRRLFREKGPTLYPIKIAIVAQMIWNSTGHIHQGLLAGMALMHFLLMQTIFRPSLDFLEDYSVVSEYYTNIFSYLVTMCVISAFDRFDLAQLDIEHYREIYAEHSSSFLSIPLYIATFCLHQSSLLIDDKISLISYPTNTTGIENNSTGMILVVEEDLATWQKVIIAKDSLAILAWLFVALGPREDMLLTHLKTMEKYVEITENSA